MKLLALPILLILSSGVFALDLFKYTYVKEWKIVISNPNSYDLANYQVRIDISDITQDLGTQQIKIVDVNRNKLNFCYEQSNGECNTTPSNIIWVKVPFIPANGETYLIITKSDTNEAVNGEEVFDFYEDFEDGDLSEFELEGDGEWTVVDTNVYQGVYSAGTPSLDKYQKASMKLTVSCDMKCVLEFYDSAKLFTGEAYSFLIDGNEQYTLTGYYHPLFPAYGYKEYDWTLRKYELNQGEHILKWKYQTGFSATTLESYVRVDLIKIRKKADKDVVIQKKKWVALDFSNITFVEPDLSNVRVECENCEYYLVDKHKLLINNSATIYITAEKTHQKRTDVPKELLVLKPSLADLEIVYEVTAGTKLFSVPIGIEEWTFKGGPVIFFHVRSTTEIDVYSYDGSELKKQMTINPSLGFSPQGVYYIKSIMNENGLIVVVLRYTDYYNNNKWWYGVLKYDMNSNKLELVTQCVLSNQYYYNPIYVTNDKIYYYYNYYNALYYAPITNPCLITYVKNLHNAFQTVFYVRETKGYGHWSGQIYELDFETFSYKPLNIYFPSKYNYRDLSSVVYPYLTLRSYTIVDYKKIPLEIKVYNLETQSLYFSIDITIDLSDKFNSIYEATVNPICSDQVCYIFIVANGQAKDNNLKTILFLYELDLKTYELKRIGEIERYGGNHVCGFFSKFMKAGIYGVTATYLTYNCQYHFIGVYKIAYFDADALQINLDVLDLDVVNKVAVLGFVTNNKEIISGLKVSYITQKEELELLKEGNWKIYDTAKFYVKDYETLNTLKTYDLKLGQVTSLTIDIENYPVTTKVFAFDKLTYILANETPSIQLLLPKLDIARILRIYVQPAGYWVYVLRKTGTKYELVDVKKSQPTITGELNFFIPDTDYLRFEFYDAQGNLVYTYEDIITGNDYQFRLATNENTDQEQISGISYELTTREKSLDIVEEAPKTFNPTSMKWIFKEPVKDIEIFYLTNNTWYKLTISNVNSKTVELNTQELIDLSNVIRIHYVFVFEDNRTVWFTFDLKKEEFGLELITEKVKENVLLQIIVLVASLFAYAIIIIRSKSEYFHIVSGIAITIILALLGVVAWYHAILICATLWLAGKGLSKWSV